ncbi:hypothetical protein TorRG33x02_136340, partial [Trema orientale]
VGPNRSARGLLTWPVGQPGPAHSWADPGRARPDPRVGLGLRISSLPGLFLFF